MYHLGGATEGGVYIGSASVGVHGSVLTYRRRRVAYFPNNNGLEILQSVAAASSRVG